GERGDGMRPGKIVLLVAGVLIGLVGLGLASGGVLLLVAASQREAAGYFATDTQRLSTPTYALVSHLPVVVGDRQGSEWLHDLATIRVRATATGGTPIFVGIAPRDDVDRWLAGVAYDEVTDVASGRSSVSYRSHPGTHPATAPAAQGFWTASSSGAAPQ